MSAPTTVEKILKICLLFALACVEELYKWKLYNVLLLSKRWRVVVVDDPATNDDTYRALLGVRVYLLYFAAFQLVDMCMIRLRERFAVFASWMFVFHATVTLSFAAIDESADRLWLYVKLILSFLPCRRLLLFRLLASSTWSHVIDLLAGAFGTAIAIWLRRAPFAFAALRKYNLIVYVAVGLLFLVLLSDLDSNRSAVEEPIKPPSNKTKSFRITLFAQLRKTIAPVYCLLNARVTLIGFLLYLGTITHDNNNNDDDSFGLLRNDVYLPIYYSVAAIVYASTSAFLPASLHNFKRSVFLLIGVTLNFLYSTFANTRIDDITLLVCTGATITSLNETLRCMYSISRFSVSRVVLIGWMLGSLFAASFHSFSMLACTIGFFGCVACLASIRRRGFNETRSIIEFSSLQPLPSSNHLLAQKRSNDQLTGPV